MSVADKAQILKAAYQAEIDQMDQQKSDLQQKIALVDGMVADSQAEVDAAKASQPAVPVDQQVQDIQAKLDAANASLAQSQADLTAAKQAQADAEAKLSKDESEIEQVKAAVNEQPPQA